MQINHTRPACEPDASIAGVVESGGGRYDYCVWRVGGQWYAAFPDYHASSPIGSTTDHRPDYIAEKMRVSIADARVMAAIINQAIAADRPSGGSLAGFLEAVFNG